MKKNQKYGDYIVIDPFSKQDFLMQIKGSKHKYPYITCEKFKGLKKLAT